MNHWLQYIFGSTATRDAASEIPRMSPDAPFYAVGDIHGSTTLLDRVLNQIAASGDTQDPVVFLGDYVDRGDDSAGTLSRLYDLSRDTSRCWIFLRGNHEQLLLDFLDEPEKTGPFWLMAGGRQTLASYGLALPGRPMVSDDFVGLSKKLREHLGAEIEYWLRTLPFSWQSGNLFLSHAGTDPALDLDKQNTDTLLWGHGSAPARPRPDGIWSVQGHVIMEKPLISQGRIFLDTGAYATRVLSAARFSERGASFFST